MGPPIRGGGGAGDGMEENSPLRGIFPQFSSRRDFPVRVRGWRGFRLRKVTDEEWRNLSGGIGGEPLNLRGELCGGAGWEVSVLRRRAADLFRKGGVAFDAGRLEGIKAWGAWPGLYPPGGGFWGADFGVG